ncbi:MAG: TolC family protein, partial [Gemmatimonadales bacterium]
FHRAGTGSDFDLLTAQVQVDNIRPRLIEARNRLELDLNNLKRAIDIPLDRRLELSDSLTGPAPQDSLALEDAVARALENRSDLRVQRTTVALQSENLTAERRGMLPSLNLEAQLTRRAASADLIPPERDFIQSTTVGLVLEFPIFDGLARSGRIQQAEAALDRERFRLQRARMTVHLEVQQALQALGAAREQVEASRGTVRRAEEALHIAQVRFANGLSTQVEVNDAELAVTEARTNQASARYAYSVARARLQAAMGER